VVLFPQVLAPSLHQINFNATATQFVGGVPFEVSTFSNDSPAAKALEFPIETRRI
jgi:iron complex outermembrane receptor protein